MTSMRKDMNNALAQNPQDTGLFLREADSALCDSFCERIVKDGLNLAIVGANDAIVDHYCSMLVKRLRTLPDVRLEVYSTTDTEALLDSFNTILASLSTAEAIGGRNTSAPLRILIASDADHINPVQGRLLARLVSNFPGANTQLILLQTDSAGDKPMSILGNRLLHWLVPMPSPDEARKMLAIARHTGREPDATKLLNKINPLLLQEPSRQSTLPAPTNIEEINSDRQTPGKSEIDESHEATPGKKRSAFSRALLWGIMVITAALVVSGLFPRQYGAIRSALIGQDPVKTENQPPKVELSQLSPPSELQVKEKIQTSAPSSPASVPALDPNTTTAAPETSSDLSGANQISGKQQYKFPAPLLPPYTKSATAIEKPPAPPLNTPQPVATAPIAPSVTPGTPSGKIRFAPEGEAPVQPGKTTVSALGKASPERPATIRIDASPMQSLQARSEPSAAIPRQLQNQPQGDKGSSEAVSRVRAAPRKQFFVQHIALNSYSEAQDWRIATPVLSGSLIVPVVSRPAGTIKFAVVSGPFSTSQDALAFSRGQGVPTEHWLRSAGSLTDALAPTN